MLFQNRSCNFYVERYLLPPKYKAKLPPKYKAKLPPKYKAKLPPKYKAKTYRKFKENQKGTYQADKLITFL